MDGISNGAVYERVVSDLARDAEHFVDGDVGAVGGVGNGGNGACLYCHSPGSKAPCKGLVDGTSEMTLIPQIIGQQLIGGRLIGHQNRHGVQAQRRMKHFELVFAARRQNNGWHVA